MLSTGWVAGTTVGRGCMCQQQAGFLGLGTVGRSGREGTLVKKALSGWSVAVLGGDSLGFGT